MNAPLLIVCASELGIEQMSAESFLWNSLLRDSEPHLAGIDSKVYFLEDRFDRFDTLIFSEDFSPLSKVYNTAIQYLNEKGYERVLFVDENLSIEDSFFFHKAKKSLTNNQIIGLAGAAEVNLDSSDSFSTSWLGFSKEADRLGSLTHYAGPDTVLTSSYGATPRECKVIDGSFILCDVKSIIDNDLKFDEKITCDREFYDLDFCLEAGSKGLKISTWPIWTTLKPPPAADEDAEEFRNGRRRFFEKWEKVD